MNSTWSEKDIGYSYSPTTLSYSSKHTRLIDVPDLVFVENAESEEILNFNATDLRFKIVGYININFFGITKGWDV